MTHMNIFYLKMHRLLFFVGESGVGALFIFRFGETLKHWRPQRGGIPSETNPSYVIPGCSCVRCLSSTEKVP